MTKTLENSGRSHASLGAADGALAMAGNALLVESCISRLFPDRRIERVLLVNPPDSTSEMFSFDTAKRGRYTNYPPYGLMTLAEHLRALGILVQITNLNHETLKQTHAAADEAEFSHHAVWTSVLDKEIADFAPQLVGVGCMFTMTHGSLKAVCERIAVTGVPIAIGGVHVTNDVERVLDDIPVANIAILREGERAFRTLVQVVNQKADVSALGQIVFNVDEERYHVSRECMPLPADLDVIPAWDLVDAGEYSRFGTIGSFHYLKPKDSKISTVLSNRGCRAQCTFCSVRNFNGMGVRQRDVSAVVDELELLESEYGVDHVMWLDDDLLKDEKRAVSLFNEMVKRGLSLTWDATNGLLSYSCTDEVIHAAAESGCIAVCIGIESGNPKILREVKKPGTVEIFQKTAQVLRKYPEIYSSGLLMVGLPGETLSQIMDTVTLAREMDLDWYRISPLQPLPNTSIYESMVADGLIDDVGSSDVRFAGGAYGKQVEVEQGRRIGTLDFEDAFSQIAMDDVPDLNQIEDIWVYMNYHLNFHRLLHENRPMKLTQQVAMLEVLSDVISPENAFSLYYLGVLQYKMTGKVDPSIFDRLVSRLDSSPYWFDRLKAFGLAPEDLQTMNFDERLEPHLLPKGYGGWRAA